ncbi:coiled-coil domain-containing protein 33-like [Babylonia areolata]|uniref:coiled-coil domain-containing protein 33-like n=1 Tax=Babylonia areolata TaxID=304850 RepID=UPI003FD366AC
MATLYYRPYTTEPIKDGDMPAYDAMESALPEYQYIFNDPQAPKSGADPPPPARAANSKPTAGTRASEAPHRNARVVTDLDQTSMSVMDQQMREIDNYRQAVTRMGQDILSLRASVQELEGTNSKLRMQLSNFNDATRVMMDSVEVDGLPKAEIASRYAALKQTLTSQTSELKHYKDKVQKLQNDLIKKNDNEKEFLRMSHAHASQQKLLQKLQDKIHKVKQLEDTCRKQEKVIEKMELILEKQRQKKGNSTKDANSEANAALTEENKRLREEMENLREQVRKATQGSGGAVGGGWSSTDDFEKLELYQALEKAEGRIMSLEKQMVENSRQWGKERASLQLRLTEQDGGSYGKPGGLFLRDIP